MHSQIIIRGAVVFLLMGIVTSHLFNNPEWDKIWDEFKEQHGKRFKDRDHELKRRHLFEDALELIHQHNAEADLGKHTYRLGLTQFADWTREEFKTFVNLMRPDDVTVEPSETSTDEDVQFVTSSSLPDTVNWVTQGAVTSVKNQGSCGCCYTFSAAGALEGQLFIKTGKLVDLSEQNLLDCSGSLGNLGCDGGAMQYTFQYVKQNGGIDTDKSYPFTGKVGKCQYKPENSAATCTGYKTLPSGDESALQKAVATVGPISIAIDASSLQFYRSGVYSSSKCSSTKLDHAVLLVGYGTSSSGQQYWQVKNSWGTRWGMNGYFELARNQNNMCGVATAALYPTM